MAFSDNLKIFRTQKKLTQKELADIIGVAQANIAHYELGVKVPTVIIAVKLAHALNTTCEELVNGNFEEPKE